MKLDLGSGMICLRISEAEAVDDARILALRKKRREELLAKARNNPKPPCFIVTWFHGRRTVATI